MFRGLTLAPASKSYSTYAFMYTMVLGISSEVFVGLPVGRDSRWLKASADCQAEIWGVAAVLRPYPPFLRPLLRPFLAPKGRLAKIMRTAEDVLFPVINERLRGKDKHVDLLQFLISTSKEVDRSAMVLRVLGLMAAAVRSETNPSSKPGMKLNMHVSLAPHLNNGGRPRFV